MRPVRLLSCAAVLTAAAGDALPSAAAEAPCAPRGSSNVIKGEGSRVYARWVRVAGGSRVRLYFACLNRRGRPYPLLRSGRGGADGYAPVRLAGPFVAYGFYADCRGCRDTRTLVVRQDLRTGRRWTHALDRRGDGREVTIWDLELARDGRLAWMQAVDADPAAIVTVRAKGRSGRIRTLDRGATIVPRSLTLRRDRLRWLVAGSRRTARLG